MRARQALNPGRIKLTFEDGSTKYAVMERADNPVVEGDPLNPYTLLKDETCTMLGVCGYVRRCCLFYRYGGNIPE